MAKTLLDEAKEALEDTVRDIKESIGLPTDRSIKERLSEAERVSQIKARQDKFAGIKRRT